MIKKKNISKKDSIICQVGLLTILINIYVNILLINIVVRKNVKQLKIW